MEIEAIEERMLGKHNDAIVRDFFGAHELTPDDIFLHGAQKEAIYRELVEPGFHALVVPGVVPFLSRYAHVPKGLASNAERANVDLVLRLAGIRDCFGAVVAGHDVKHPKPYPDIYLKTADVLGVAPEQCVVFEDSEAGVAAAHAAGMRVVGVLTTRSQFDNVDLVIRDFTDGSLDDRLEALMDGAWTHRSG
jgi:HAD superfamily hydrolase (TIGR01509 family)